MNSKTLLLALATICAVSLLGAEALNVPVSSSSSSFPRSIRFSQPSVELSSINPIVMSQQQRRVERGIKPLSPHEDWGNVLLKRQEAVLKDPRFMSCMGEADGPEDPNFMSVFAKCYSFAGRPRFGKRAWRPYSAYSEY